MDASYLQQELGLEDSHRIFSSKSGAHSSLSSAMSQLHSHLVLLGIRTTSMHVILL